jgi:subtilisin-like proprotein convertase family protein
LHSRVLLPVRALALLLMIGIPSLKATAAEVVSSRLAQVLAVPAGPSRAEDGMYGVWVTFTDRNLTGADLASRLGEARGQLSERVLNRRAKSSHSGSNLAKVGDLPVAREYRTAVAATGADFRRESRWLNAASFNATAAQIGAIAELPFVAGIDLVARYNKKYTNLTADELAYLKKARSDAAAEKNDKWSLDYGGSLGQAEILNVPPVHEMGLSGAGVIIGVIDTGFEFTHESMQSVNVLAAYDFVNNDTDVSDGISDPPNQSKHGTEVLSLLAAYREGAMIGTAYGASFILAKTEEIDQESHVEEDNFIAALEWMETLGVDVVSSQVGYVDWYEYADLDGLTAPITIACDMAAVLGVCVVTAVGDLNGEIGLPPIMAPADGRHVITVGSVDWAGQVADLSSRGPTYDGRIKPDLMAMGNGALVGSWDFDWIYPFVGGTSYATAQIAGVAALMLEQNPHLNPWQIREALRTTGDRANQPDNDYGWGIADAQAAVNYWGPVIEHEPLRYTDQTSAARTVLAQVSSRQGLISDAVVLSSRTNQGTWRRSIMTSSGGGVFSGEIPPAASGSTVEYYLEATESGGITLSCPRAGHTNPYQYEVGYDGVAPTLTHTFLMDQRLIDWPPTLRALASDNVGLAEVSVSFAISGGMEQGPFPLTLQDKYYEREFPLAAAGLAVGDVVTYWLTATDVADGANTTEVGPFAVEIVAQRARVLIIDDLSENKATENVETGHQRDGLQLSIDKALPSPALIGGWLTDAGYQVDTMVSSQVREGSLHGYQAVVLSSGQSFYPLASPEMRTQLLAYVAGGGRLLVEGGETAYAAGVTPGYPDFFTGVLHLSEVLGEGGYIFHPTHGREEHAFLQRPNRLPDTLWMGLLTGEVDYRVSDVVLPAPGSGTLYSASMTPASGGIIFHDDNTGPDQGQVLVFPIAINFIKNSVGRMLVENAMAYLLAKELPGRTAIAGQVLLNGASDHSGVAVGTDSLHTTMTDANGYYTLSGLWGGDVTLTASLTGYGSQSLALQLSDDQTFAAETMTLIPVTTLEFENSTPVSIPDNDPAGIASLIEVSSQGTLSSVSVRADISHYSINNLVVTLTSPAGTSVTLHNRSGGTADNIVGSWPDKLAVDGPGSLADFADEGIAGTWTLNVSDRQFGATGTLNSWGLTMSVATSTPSATGDIQLKTTRLLGNSPNPFNPRTVVAFELARPGRVILKIYDLRGRLVRTLADTDLIAGRHEVIWDGLDRQGSPTASGVYFTEMRAEGTATFSKMTLVR